MFRNYLKIALRNLRKQKIHAVANIFGLALGIAAAFVLTLFVRQELSYDRGFADSDRIYRIATDFFDMGGFAKSQRQLLDFLPGASSAIEYGTRFDRAFTPTAVQVGDRTFEESRFFEVDSAYFHMFSYRFLEGSSAAVMTAPDEVVLSERTAEKYFGDASPLGRVLLVGKDEKPYRVTGVVETPAFETHLAPDFWLAMAQDTVQAGAWTNITYYNYIRVKPGASEKEIEAGLDEILKTYAYPAGGAEASYEEWAASSFAPRFWVQPLTDIYLHSDFRFEITAGGNPTQVYVLGLIAVFILLIAGVNYVNLTTAAATVRMKEIGVKQSMGVERRMLVQQFLVESIVFSLIAMILATALSELLLGIYTTITGSVLVESLFNNPMHLLGLTGFSVVVGLLAGGYPAFYLSGFRPVKLLKGSWAGGENQRVRSALVVAQFAIAIGLVIGSMVIYRQLAFMQNTDKGFEHEGILVVENLHTLGDRAEAFRTQIEQQPQVALTSFTRRVPTGLGISVFTYRTPEMQEDMTIQTFRGDENYIPALGMRVIAGRNFLGDLASDSNAVILNESAVRALNLGDNPIGAQVNDNQYVVGVVSDFNYQSMREKIEPAALQFHNAGLQLVVKLQGAGLPGFLDQMRSIWQTFAPADPIRYSFMDDYQAAMLAGERLLSQAIALFTALAILIACLGLFGLTTFTIQRRTKEIGIRKVMGASTAGLVGLLSKDFLRLVLWAFVIAAPIAFFATSRWLEGFAYRIEFGWLVFLVAGVLAVGTAFLTLSYQAIRAARANPVVALRYE